MGTGTKHRMGLLLLGGRQRRLLFKGKEEWNLYEAALIYRLDPGTGEIRECVEYKSPPEARASDEASILFKAGAIKGDKLYACTSTEVVIFTLPDFKQVGYVSLPCFNDLHHVTPSADGNLLIANTGLDMVLKIDMSGTIISEWEALEIPLWSRFQRDVHYRKVESTKPHASHPNFVFELDHETWTTRFYQHDAICLDDRRRRIDLVGPRAHDGVLRGDRIYFTEVDGRVLVANRHSLQIEKDVDLKKIDGQSMLGWCRGILPVDDSKVWVGFTRIRKTDFKENVLWLKHSLREGMAEKPTHIGLYDIEKKQLCQEIDIERRGMNVIFDILPESGDA